MTLLETLTLSGSSVTSSTISGSYTNLFLNGVDIYASTGGNIAFRLNGDTGSNYSRIGLGWNNSTLYPSNELTVPSFIMDGVTTSATYLTSLHFTMTISRYSDSTHYKDINFLKQANTTDKQLGIPRWNSTSAITSITVFPESGTFSGGKIYLYGVK